MDSPASEEGWDSDETQHRVEISKPFAIVRYAVTFDVMPIVATSTDFAKVMQWISMRGFPCLAGKGAQKSLRGNADAGVSRLLLVHNPKAPIKGHGEKARENTLPSEAQLMERLSA